MVRVETYAERTTDEHERHRRGPQGFELGKTIRVAGGWRLSRQLPAEQRHKIAQEVCAPRVVSGA